MNFTDRETVKLDWWSFTHNDGYRHSYDFNELYCHNAWFVLQDGANNYCTE